METKIKQIDQFKALLAIALCDDNLHPAEIALLNNFALRHDIPLTAQQEILLDPDKHLPTDLRTIEFDFTFLVELAKMINADDVIEDSELDLLYQFVEWSKLAGTNILGWSHYLLELTQEEIGVDEIRSELEMLSTT